MLCLGGNMGVEVDIDLSKISFERSFSSGSLRGEFHSVVWWCFGVCSMFWVVNTGAFAVGVVGVWIGKAMSDHGSGDGSGPCSAVAMVVCFDHPWVCTVAAAVFSVRCMKVSPRFVRCQRVCFCSGVRGGV